MFHLWLSRPDTFLFRKLSLDDQIKQKQNGAGIAMTGIA